MVNEVSKPDLVKEARELFASIPNPPKDQDAIVNALTADAIEWGAESPFLGRTTEMTEFIIRAPELLSALCAEAEQLKSLNKVQQESIQEFQRQEKELREQINKLVNSDFVCSRCGSQKK